MTAPIITAWTFGFKVFGVKDLAEITVETPTKSGQDHAERCAREQLKKLPRCRSEAHRAMAFLLRRRSATEYRREREEAIRRAKNDHLNQPRS